MVSIATHEDVAEQLRLQKESLSTLLNHMPAMTFTKDVATGVYLACNQAFAEYAHKETPEGVAGLTDYEIFERPIAAHFVEDDRIALAMDEPYVFYEDVADAVGNPRQFQTTKLKFHDESGRLCLLGMCMDVTEMERVKREREQAAAAYQEAKSASAIYGNIVSALSEDYFNLYYVDLETNEYIEYGFRTEGGHEAAETRGTDFFEESERNAHTYIFEEDRQRFIDALDKETLMAEVDRHGTFVMQYRLLVDGAPTYVSLKASRGSDDDSHIVIGVSNIDAQVRDRVAARNAAEDRKAYARINALNNNLIVLYLVDVETEDYTEFIASEFYKELGIKTHGKDFFLTTYKNSLSTVHPEDQHLFHTEVTKASLLEAIARDGVFVMDYRLLIGDLPIYVRLKASTYEEDGRTTLVVGLLDEDAQIRQEKKIADDLTTAQRMATIDALTGVKNKYAYAQWEEQIDAQIDRGEQEAFAVVVCDINNMKIVNDLYGHSEGDECIKRACKKICNVFDHSPVFRVGGDEFVALLMGEDFARRAALMDAINALPDDRSRMKVGEAISAGMVEYLEGQHHSLKSVFAEADMAMYERKQHMKSSYMDETFGMDGASEASETIQRYELDPMELEAIERLRVPFAIYQFVNRQVVTIALSKGFCDLFGYSDRALAYLDMDHDMYKDTHPDDVERIVQEAFRFATEGGSYEVVYRTRTKRGSGYKVIHACGEHVYGEDGVRLAHIWYTDEGPEGERLLELGQQLGD